MAAGWLQLRSRVSRVIGISLKPVLSDVTVFSLCEVTDHTGRESTLASKVDTCSRGSLTGGGNTSSLCLRWGEAESLLGLGPYGEAAPLELLLTGIFNLRPVLDKRVRRGIINNWSPQRRYQLLSHCKLLCL